MGIIGLDVDILKDFKKNEIIYKSKKPKEFKSNLEKARWYEKRKKVWETGEDGLTGMHIFYLEEILLGNRVTGDTYNPICRDIDVLLFHKIEELRKKNLWMYVTKGRGIGLSTIMFTLPHWFFRMYAGAKCVATTGKDKKTLSQLFSNYFMSSYEGLDDLIRPTYLNKNETASEAFLRMEIKTKDKGGNVILKKSEFHCKETSDKPKSPTAFSGYGAIYGGFDELPLHPRRSDLIKSAKEIFIDPMTKKIEGFLLAGGTIEDNIDSQNIAEIQKFISECEALNFHSVFIPATWGNNMINGWSQIDENYARIMKEREAKAKMTDSSYLNAEIKNNPLTLDEIFSMGGSKRFEEYTVERINLQIRELSIPSNQPPIVPTSIIETDEGFKSYPNPNSAIKILEHPQDNTDYIVGIDSTMSTDNTSNGKRNSKFGLVVIKGVHPQSKYEFAPVCTYLERPKDFEITFDTAIRILKYYNKFGRAKIAGELNATGGVLLEKIQKLGMRSTIVARKDLNKSGWVDTKKAWFSRVEAIKDWQYTAANRYFKKYAERVQFIEILQDAQKADEANVDLLDAFLAALWGFGSGDILEGKTIKKEPSPIMGVRFNPSTGTYEKYNITTGQVIK